MNKAEIDRLVHLPRVPVLFIGAKYLPDGGGIRNSVFAEGSIAMTDVSLRDDSVAVDERLPDLPTAVATLALHLEQTSSGMDVIKVELETCQTSARLVFCAYRHKPAPPSGNGGAHE
jgi:hypothetical protein